MDLLIAKDHALVQILQKMQELTDYTEKKRQITALLDENTDEIEPIIKELRLS